MNSRNILQTHCLVIRTEILPIKVLTMQKKLRNASLSHDSILHELETGIFEMKSLRVTEIEKARP
jgi:hypothetical protein